MGAWGVGGDNGGRRNGNIAEGGYLSGKGGRRESGATSDPSAQERGAVLRGDVAEIGLGNERSSSPADCSEIETVAL